MNELQVALELYTVRDETRRDFAGTLRRVAQIGYAGVEFAGYGNLTSQEISALLAETGLRAVATHFWLEWLEGSEMDGIDRHCPGNGCPIKGSASMAHEWRTR